MTDPIAAAIAATIGRPSEMLTGLVVDPTTATTLTLLIRGTSTPCAYLAAYSPVAGDLVAVMRQDATYLVLGALGGVGANQVQNFSFEEDDPTSSVPAQWTQAAITGAASVSAVTTNGAPAGQLELSVSSGDAAADTYVYSAPIGVTPGERWAASALAAAVYPAGVDPSAEASLYALWFADSTSLYPATAAADTLIATATDIGPAPDHTPISDTVTVPTAASFMRIATRSTTAAGITVLWDAVTARRTA